MAALSGRETDIQRGDNGTLALTGAALCFAACATVVLYGIYLIVAQLHHQTPTTGSGPQTKLSGAGDAPDGQARFFGQIRPDVRVSRGSAYLSWSNIAASCIAALSDDVD